MMSSLGQKVKEIFSSSESPAAARGEVDPNTPGSFPVDDMRPKEDTTTSTTTGHEHHKLHKSNDPRGWSEGDEASRGHAYKDSGVGLTDSAVPHREVTSSNPNPSESLETNEPLETSEPLERTAEPVSDRRLDDSTNLATSEGTSGLGGDSTKQHAPYWGDISQGQGTYNTVAGHGSAEDKERIGGISQGQGVYNTVTGHGSAEDNQRSEGLRSGAQDTIPIGGSSQLSSTLEDSESQTTDPVSSQRDIPQASGVYNTVAGHGSAEDTERTSGLQSGSGTLGQSQSQTTDPLSYQRDTRNPDEKTSGSHHLAEGLGGAALGAGAYGLSKDRKADKTAPYQGSDDAATAAARAAFITKGTEPYSSQGDSALSSGARQSQSADPYDSQRAAHNPEEQNTGSRFFEGLTRFTAGTTGAGAHEHHKHRKDDEATKTTEEPHESKGRSFPLLHRDHKDKEVKEHKQEKEPKEKFGGLFHRSHKDKDEVEPTRTDEDKHHSSTAAAAALGAAGAGGAAYAATRDRRDDDKTQDTTTSGRYQDSSVPQSTGQHGQTTFVNQPSGAGYSTSQGYTTQTGQSQDPLARDSTSQQQGSHGHRGAELGTAAAAGLGAGALASHHGNSKHQDPPAYGTQSSQSTDPLTRDPAQQQGSNVFGTQTAFGTQSSQSTDPLATSQQQPSNVFGTQSAFGTQSTQPTDPLARDSFQQHEGSHRGTGLATGAAAGLGAAALASHGHHGQQDSSRQDSYGTQGTQSSSTGVDPIRGSGTQYDQPTNPLASDAQRDDSYRGTGLATGAAIGLGAGALGSRSQHDNTQDFTQDSSRGYQPGSGISSTGRDTTTGDSFSDKRTSSDSNPPILTQHANEGQYNTLASGTPSGVRIDDDFEDTQSTPRDSTRSVPTESKDKHYGAGAAGVGAAAAGAAGTAAYLSRDKDEKNDEPIETEKPKTERELEREKPVTRDFASTTGISGTSKSIIHKCEKCGEDNDISKYFTGKN